MTMFRQAGTALFKRLPCADSSFTFLSLCTRSRTVPSTTTRRQQWLSISTNPVEKQKARALALWRKTTETDTTIPAEISSSVTEDLKNAMVPPIFHALVSDEHKRPFHASNRHTPSPESVVAGTCVKNRRASTLELEGDYYDMLLTADRTQAKQNIYDRGLREMWKFSAIQTDNIVALVNAKARMIGEDVEVTERLPSSFQMPSIDPVNNLVTRRLSRGVVADCFGSCKLRSSLAISGSPGIGKSWTLIYALQQALLYDTACVLFFLQKDKLAYLCIRWDNRIFVWTAATGWDAGSSLFRQEDVLVLLDPRESKDGGASYANGPRMLIFAASNNEAHYKNDIYKVQDYPERHLGPWTKEELTVALPMLLTGIDADTAFARAKVVGMLPRYLLAEAAFKQRQELLHTTVKTLLENCNEMKSILNWNGKEKPTEAGGKTVRGTIFVVSAALTSTYEEVGYDGQTGVDYAERKLSIMSEAVMKEVVMANRKSILSFWGVTDDYQLSGMGKAVEDLFWGDMQASLTGVFSMTRSKMERKGRSKMERKGQSMMESKQAHATGHPADNLMFQQTSVTPPTDLENVRSVLDGVNKICRMVKNCPLIDFAGPGRKVYQVTVSPDHSMSQVGMTKLLTQSGHLIMDDGMLKPADPAPSALEFYWVVPRSGFGKQWKGKSPKTFSAGKDDDDSKKEIEQSKIAKQVLRQCLEMHVVQYILVLDDGGPVQESMQQDMDSDVAMDYEF